MQPGHDRNRKLWQFHGGLHLDGHKAESTAEPIAQIPLAKRLILPLQQHIGAAAQPLVAVGETVRKGQPVARAKGYISAALHAPSSGRVLAIEDHTVAHPSGLSAPCILIETDGEERWAELPAPLDDFLNREPAELRERIRWAGIVGMGGAAFPTGVKLNPGADRPINTLILNGAECEPYISCDDLLMRERAERVITGARILKYLLRAQTCLIGIEDNKPEAIAAMREALVQNWWRYPPATRAAARNSLSASSPARRCRATACRRSWASCARTWPQQRRWRTRFWTAGR